VSAPATHTASFYRENNTQKHINDILTVKELLKIMTLGTENSQEFLNFKAKEGSLVSD
jgi:hypothetical protein